MKTLGIDWKWGIAVLSTSAALALSACGGSRDDVAQVKAGTNTPPAMGGYYIDGNVPDDPTDPPTVTIGNVTDGYGAGATGKELGPKNGTATKLGVIHSAPLPMLEVTNPNGQVDYRQAWASTNKDSSGNIWLYFAWERDANTGSGFIAWEFQQSEINLPGDPVTCDFSNLDPTTCNPWRYRQPGDFLLVWDQQGGSKDIYLRFFELPQGVSRTDWDFGQPLVLGAPTKLNLGVDYNAAYSANGFRGEAVVNLSATVFQPNTCVSIATVIPSTVTGNSDTADYKDTILGDFGITISNCGELKIVKATVPTGQTVASPYAVARAGAGLVQYPSTTSLSATLTGHGDFDEYTKLLEATDYTLGETFSAATLAAGWQLQTIVCVENDGAGTSKTIYPVPTAPATPYFRVVAGQKTVCTITNRLNLGGVRIMKKAINKGGDPAAAGYPLFPLAGATFQAQQSSVSKGTCTTAADGTCCIDGLLFGNYTVVETAAPTGYAKAASQALTVSAAADCDATTLDIPAPSTELTYENNPLYKLVFKRDATFVSKAGAGVIAATIQCTDSPVFPGEPTSPAALTTFTRERVFDDIELSSTNTSDTYTFSCTVQVDP